MNEPEIRIITAEPRRAPWGAVLAVGIVVLLAGIGLVIWPFVTASNILAVLFGIALMANGLALLVRQGPAGAARVVGALFLLAGLLAIVFAEFTVQALVVVVGATMLVTGVVWIALGARAGGPRSGWLLVPGVLAILGGIFALIWPATALGIVAFCAGLAMLAFGGSLIWGAIGMRKTRIDRTTIIVED